MKKEIVAKCRKLLRAYRSGELGDTRMPEEASPKFSPEEKEARLVYFTLPMALNYQRDSYKLWESALETFGDSETRQVFNVSESANLSEEKLRQLLLRYELALQPNRHIDIWSRVSKTIADNWKSIGSLLQFADNDFLKLKHIVQEQYKKGFPYLSGPKIFNYWSFVIQEFGKVALDNSRYIEIAPDTHVIKGSIRLGVITENEAKGLTKEKISEKWRRILSGSGINPIDMHSPLWFWSRNGFKFRLN